MWWINFNAVKIPEELKRFCLKRQLGASFLQKTRYFEYVCYRSFDTAKQTNDTSFSWQNFYAFFVN